jgi:hypothetical protein
VIDEGNLLIAVGLTSAAQYFIDAKKKGMIEIYPRRPPTLSPLISRADTILESQVAGRWTSSGFPDTCKKGPCSADQHYQIGRGRDYIYGR